MILLKRKDHLKAKEQLNMKRKTQQKKHPNIAK